MATPTDRDQYRALLSRLAACTAADYRVAVDGRPELQNAEELERYSHEYLLQTWEHFWTDVQEHHEDGTLDSFEQFVQDLLELGYRSWLEQEHDESEDTSLPGYLARHAHALRHLS